MTDRVLPHPNGPELKEVLRGRELQVIYSFLYVRRDDPPTMAEIRRHVETTIGKPHEQTDRRVRDLRKTFSVLAERVKGHAHEHRYRLVGWADKRRGNRSNLSHRVEAEVFETYGYRCAMCGRNPKEDGIKLVIDHKIPVAWGGTDDIENLQVLCEDHNHGKQAHYASFDEFGDVIRAVLNFTEPHLRIGELLKLLKDKPVPVSLIQLIAREENRGDPTRRLRELRALGWRISVMKRKEGLRTNSYYTLEHCEPWPEGGPRAAISRIENDRKRRKRSRLGPLELDL
ncbi:HNH endonuclease signature motif containing protein [Longimicrobium sp.]|uniref:HNH endonuclease n=1 Tax=Longimicrobium sp. TaxID=2029185 RepID=UPI0032C213E0